MRQSNTYVILFSVGLTIVLGGLLSIAAIGLKPIQEVAIELDTKKQILGSVMDVEGEIDVLGTFDERINGFAINIEGEKVETDEEGTPIEPIKISMDKQSKKEPEAMMLPVYTLRNENDPEKVDAYIFALYGNGLWDKIWGYIAVAPDLTTVKGITLDHKGETPGLGARITSPDIQNRYKGKELFDADGTLVGVNMQKGERGDPSIYNEHQVDGMSGATLTGNGVNDMIIKYIGYYQAYIDKVKDEDTMALN